MLAFLIGWLFGNEMKKARLAEKRAKAAPPPAPRAVPPAR